MELLPAVVGLAALDSINPSALLATVALLLRGRPARPLVAVYVAAVLVTYFAVGLALTLGLGLTPETVIRSDAAYLAQAALGAGMLAYAVLAPGRTRQRGAATARRVPAATRPAAVFALGVAVTALELPTALPYLGAVGMMTRADLAVADWLPLLVTYNLIFVLPRCCCWPATWSSETGPARRWSGCATAWAGPPERRCCGFSAWSGSSCSPTPSAGSRSSAEHAAPAAQGRTALA
jgi:cytochrome c biogenesis protein CcdA